MTKVVFVPVEKKYTKENTVEHTGEEGRVEDELSPEEIQMVRRPKHPILHLCIYKLYMTMSYYCVFLFVR